jgi:16S rRNA (uracil1498-N3)-methyltransferase
MDKHRFYEVFDSPDHLVLSDATLHHMLHVLRMKSGEEVLVLNGRGLRCSIRLDRIDKKGVAFTLLQSEEVIDTRPALHLGIAFTKNPARMEWLLEKATEIGIHTIIPLHTQRSEKTHNKRERFEKILVSAFLQSKQDFLPQLEEPCRLNDVLATAPEQRFIAWCDDDSPRHALTEVLKKHQNTLILIGPEGDFTPDEVHLCTQQGCLPVHLGPSRLRTETAGLYACVVFNAQQ